MCMWLELTGAALVPSPPCPRVSVCPQRLCYRYCPSTLHLLRRQHAGNWDSVGLSSPLQRNTRNTVIACLCRELYTPHSDEPWLPYLDLVICSRKLFRAGTTSLGSMSSGFGRDVELVFTSSVWTLGSADSA